MPASSFGTPGFNFGPLPRFLPNNPLAAPAPFFSLGANAIEQHRKGLSIIFVVLLVLPLATFGLGLVARDLGWEPRFLPRRNVRGARRRPSS